MHWAILIISAVLEAVWATALDYSQGFSRPGATAVFLVAVVLSMAGLGYAMRGIGIGTAYAVWTGLGAVLTVLYSVLFSGEPAGVLKMLFLAGIIGCVIGLKLVDGKDEQSDGGAERPGATAETRGKQA
ncbi:multidrug-transport integral membrane protein Mmr-like protein [Arthrobacter crystallopoietes BAB-32]|uniref:Multidrug-transport integral membrane protein Mmr-like protein n=1 Tax=Arthrobacter crystallopoietes BAB-32 TaxID=1246476 RepID=N1UVK9_9MICC|nr:multidrug efflux SMR transporter [Arthrobacter crystallopoietes]EMY34441.1 multidrug-transport integral membrane protein Mmr-like protein [Arthrobacter crystallopoietes BAB-32]